ncbi:MAG: hypothetical protein MI723_11845 [Caulobacterales bacterium]|nr:hypothetical protein [Caulobacterales bacterium]
MNDSSPSAFARVSGPDGPHPKRFTIADGARMAEMGVIAPDERVELIAWEIIVSPPK